MDFFLQGIIRKGIVHLEAERPLAGRGDRRRCKKGGGRGAGVPRYLDDFSSSRTCSAFVFTVRR